MSLSAALLLLAELAAATGGPVRHYVRANSDGSEAERVVVYAPSAGEVAVFKGRAPCTNAASVTGRLDPATGQVRELVGGRLTRDLTQETFGRLAPDGAGSLALRIDMGGEAVAMAVPVGPRWVLYDFDFSDLIARPPPKILARQDLRFELPLLLTGETPSFENLGLLELTLAGEMPHLGRPTMLYRASGPALDGGEGLFWFDSRDGRLVEARLPIPNHAEYRDFTLTLVREGQGESAWQEALADHWRDCPPGS